MLKKLVKNFTSWLMGTKAEKDSPLNLIPDPVFNKLVDQANELADVVEQASTNVVEEVKKEVENVVSVAKKKAPAKKKTSTPKKPAAKKKKA
jgi:uncharacterized protein YdcH (DUF465 family)